MDRLPYVVAHELIHYQQKYPRNQNSTLLTRAVGEGSADFIAELISGSHINPHLHEYGNPIEKELWLEFQKEIKEINPDVPLIMISGFIPKQLNKLNGIRAFLMKPLDKFELLHAIKNQFTFSS